MRTQRKHKDAAWQVSGIPLNWGARAFSSHQPAPGHRFVHDVFFKPMHSSQAVRLWAGQWVLTAHGPGGLSGPLPICGATNFAVCLWGRTLMRSI